MAAVKIKNSKSQIKKCRQKALKSVDKNFKKVSTMY